MFNKIGSKTILGISVIFVIAAVVVDRFILGRTVFGRPIDAIGNNEEAVRLSGHDPSTDKIAAFAVSSRLAWATSLR